MKQQARKPRCKRCGCEFTPLGTHSTGAYCSGWCRNEDAAQTEARLPLAVRVVDTGDDKPQPVEVKEE